MTETRSTLTGTCTIPAPAKLLTVNAERRLHWAKIGEIVRLWRHAAATYARQQKVPKFAWCEIEVTIAQARGVLADAGAHYPVVKAVVDGLVDAGVLENDNSEHVRSILQHPPRRENVEMVTLRLKGERR